MAIVTERIAVTTTGSAGSATGSETSGPLKGFLLDVYLDYHASAPATTDVTLADAKHSDSIVVVSDTNTDGRYFPRKQAHDAAGAAISGVYELFPLNDAITVSVAQADALTDCVVAYVRYLEE